MNIDKIKELLKSLRAKAQDKGATEAEAMEAMKAALKLSAKYGVSLDDLKDEDNVTINRYDTASNGDKSYLHEVDSLLATSIAKFCDCRVWRDGGNICFAGIDSDIEFAVFVRDRLKATMEFEYEIYREFVHEGRITAGVRKSFMMGFASRVIARLKEFKAEQATFDKDSTALVVRKTDLVNTWVEKNVGALYAGRRGRYGNVHAGAYASGQYSGGQADIGRGVSRGNAGLLT